MAEPVFELDAAWQAVLTARERGDASTEALALTGLGQALCEASRWLESDHIHELAAEKTDTDAIAVAQARALLRRGEEVEAYTESMEDHELHVALVRAERAYEQAAAILGRLEGRQAELHAIALHRAADARRRWPLVAPGIAEVAFIGFIAVKLVGPFVEAFAKKLGEQLGESTVRALGRISLHLGHGGKSHDELTVQTTDAQWDPEAERVYVPPARTVFVLPTDLTDAAKLAIIDFDVTAPEHQNRVMLWNEAMASWQAIELAEYRRANDPFISRAFPAPDVSGQDAPMWVQADLRRLLGQEDGHSRD